MKIQYMSDLHLECLSLEQIHKVIVSIIEAVPDASVLVLAGDIGNLSSGNLTTFLEAMNSRYDKILYVLGNHEYYYPVPIVDIKNRLLALSNDYSNLEILDNRCIEIEGKLIGGTTLWFDTFHPDSVLNMRKLNDFQMIPGGWVFLRDQEIKAELFIRQLLVGKIDLDLLITHHGVTSKVHSMWEGYKTNIFFYKDIEESLKYLGIPYVIHGHQHNSHDYTINCHYSGTTKVLMNPKGYPYESNSGFDVSKCIEL